MAHDAVTKMDLPEIKADGNLFEGQPRLELRTSKDIMGRLASRASVSWVSDGFIRFALGADFHRTYARSAQRATQTNIDAQHATTFTVDMIAQIKMEVIAHYATRIKPRKTETETAVDKVTDPLAFDYTNQAWIQNGVYTPCGHDKPCDCFGTVHAGEPAREGADIQ